MESTAPSNAGEVGTEKNSGPDFRKVLLVGTGALSVAFLPFWLNWLEDYAPDGEIRVVLTRSARRFVSADALAAMSRQHVVIDEWNSVSAPDAPHITLARWPDVVLVHPATAHFFSRFALGVVDTPVLLALQATRALVGIAPAFPPGAECSPTLRAHLDVLAACPRVVVAPTVPARSATTGETSNGGVAPLPELMTLVTERHRVLTAAAGPAPTVPQEHRT
ncbi:peptide terminal cysteine decarboxylase LxmD [Streptomyces sp. NPDC093097]|uniref:peptide terminal cysteine decarboxylase LxmD n=1 Tax=Streptomyces sp. NPDC093097 TaxID=3366027 RepID=UPI00381C864D